MDQKSKANEKMEVTQVGWGQSVVMICSDCAKPFPVSADMNASLRLKQDLKAIAKSELGSNVRVITTSCLNICPENKLAITIADKTDPNVFKAIAVEPEISGSELFKVLFLK